MTSTQFALQEAYFYFYGGIMVKRLISFLLKIYLAIRGFIIQENFKKSLREVSKETERWYTDVVLEEKVRLITNCLSNYFGLKPKIFKDLRVFRSKFPRSYFSSEPSPVIVIGQRPIEELHKIDEKENWVYVHLAEEIMHFLRWKFVPKSGENVHEFFGRLGDRIVDRKYPGFIAPENIRSATSGKIGCEYKIRSTRDRIRTQGLDEFSRQSISNCELELSNEMVQLLSKKMVQLEEHEMDSLENHLHGYVAAENIEWDVIENNRHRLLKMSDKEILKLMEEVKI